MTLREITGSFPMDNSGYSIAEYEEIMIGAILGGNVDTSDISHIKPNVFIIDECSRAFSTILKINNEMGFVDYVAFLTEHSKSIGSGNAKKFTDKVVSKVPENFNFNSTLSAIEENYVRRESVGLLQRAQHLIQQTPFAASDIMYSAFEKIDSLVEMKVDFSLKEEADTVANEIVSGTMESVIKTGLKSLDTKVGGLSVGEITVIGGRPGSGKTTTSVSLAKSILDANPKIKIVKFELEMSKKLINVKFLSSLSGVSSYKMRINDLTEEDKGKILEAAEKYKQYDGRLYIFDNVYDLPTMNKIIRSTGAKIAMVDFVSLMEGVEDDKRNELGKIAKYAKRFAKDNGVAYIFYSQLSREVERRDTHLPQKSDLAESDQLTQYAGDIWLLFYRYQYTFDPKEQHDLFFILDKTRFATTGNIKLFADFDKIILRDI